MHGIGAYNVGAEWLRDTKKASCSIDRCADRREIETGTATNVAIEVVTNFKRSSKSYVLLRIGCQRLAR